MSSARRTLLPDPAGLWGLTLFIILCGIGGAKALKDGDTLWHIRMGQEMIARGEILKTDLFSHTVYGQPWHAHEWLWEIIMAAVHDRTGLAGVVILSLAVVGLTFTLIFKITTRYAGEGLATSLAMAMALPYIYIHLLARPHLFTWLGATLTLYLLERGGRWPWLLVPITALWANLHGGVLFGLVLQVIFLAGNCLDRYRSDLRNWLGTCWGENRAAFFVLLACVAAALVNPFGYQIFLFPFKVAAPVFAQGISEWKAPDFQELWFAKPWVIGIVLMMFWSGRKISWRWNLLVLFLFWQTLGHVRNLSIAALLLIPCFAMFFKEVAADLKLRRKERNDRTELVLSPWSGPVLTVLLALGFSGLIAWDVAGAREIADKRFPPAKENLAEVVAFLEKGYPSGNLLNDYEWGDYLVYAFKNPPRVFIDGRADMYGEEVFSDHSKILDMDKEAERLLEKYQVSWTLLQKDTQLGRYLLQCRGWQLLYTDDSIEILAKGK